VQIQIETRLSLSVHIVDMAETSYKDKDKDMHYAGIASATAVPAV
jgi:hypothetical protein